MMLSIVRGRGSWEQEEEEEEKEEKDPVRWASCGDGDRNPKLTSPTHFPSWVLMSMFGTQPAPPRPMDPSVWIQASQTFSA